MQARASWQQLRFGERMGRFHQHQAADGRQKRADDLFKPLYAEDLYKRSGVECARYAAASEPQNLRHMRGDGSNWNYRASNDERQAQGNQAHRQIERNGRFSIEANRIHETGEPEFPAAEADETAEAPDRDAPAKSSLEIGAADRPHHGPYPLPLTACVHRTACADQASWQAFYVRTILEHHSRSPRAQRSDSISFSSRRARSSPARL